MTLEQLNTSDRPAFVTALGWIFEHSPWVAERAWESRPFSSTAHLRETMQAAVEQASREQQLALLRAHPDLGTKIDMSDASAREQSGAGLSRLDADWEARLRTLNDAYRTRFGFPFLYAVKGAAPAAILASLESRITHGPDEEFREALVQVFRIAGFRLDDAIEEER
jgi:2-oxo-4-hydroxy-4-carboxy-5-ureidoimidazoline decarboxylase